jgi:transposase-like protein
MLRVSKKKRRIHSAAFKEAAVAKMKGCDSVVGLAQKLGVNWRLVYRWRHQAESRARIAEQSGLEQLVAKLEAELTSVKTALADKVMEADFFEQALQRYEAHRQKHGGVASTTRSGK